MMLQENRQENDNRSSITYLISNTEASTEFLERSFFRKENCLQSVAYVRSVLERDNEWPCGHLITISSINLARVNG